MTKQKFEPEYHDYLEYHGNTTIERIRKRKGIVIKQEWILFDSTEEAMEYFNNCG